MWTTNSSDMRVCKSPESLLFDHDHFAQMFRRRPSYINDCNQGKLQSNLTSDDTTFLAPNSIRYQIKHAKNSETFTSERASSDLIDQMQR
jgi:hypothetical protein